MNENIVTISILVKIKDKSTAAFVHTFYKYFTLPSIFLAKTGLQGRKGKV